MFKNPFRRSTSRDDPGDDRSDAERIDELKWLWRSACTGTALGRAVYTPSGIHVGIPMIMHVDLRPPVSFTVQLRAGQVPADVVEAAPRIAPVLGADDVHVTELAPGRVRVVLLTRPTLVTPQEPPVQPSRAPRTRKRPAS